jgi:hypothetical protein
MWALAIASPDCLVENVFIVPGYDAAMIVSFLYSHRII